MADPKGAIGFSNIIYIAIDGDYCIDHVSSGAEIYLDNSEARLRGKRIFETLPQDHPLIINVQRPGDFSLYNLSYALPHYPFENFDLHQKSSDDGGAEILVYARSEASDRNWSSQAQAIIKQASNMAAMLAHEVRNPLGAIKGSAQLLAMNADEEDIELIHVIEEESARLGRLINEFEDLSAQSTPNRERVNIHLVVNQTLRAAKTGFARDMNIYELFDPSLPDIYADPDRLQRALSNILKNASEAIEERHPDPKRQSRIEISTRYRRGLKRSGALLPIEVSITDNGGGIEPQMIKDVFKPFVTSKTNGTGLGLSVVAGIIEEIGGIVEIDRVNHGTEIRILLPVWSE